MPKPPLLKSAVTRRQVMTFAAAGAVIAVIVIPFLQTGPVYEGGSLSVAEAHAQAQSGAVTLIDIRRPDEWKLTGIGEGAHPIDMRRKDFVQALADLVGPDRTVPIALICARGVRSARMSKKLTEAGYVSVIDVPEGMLGSVAGPGWLAQNIPTRVYEDPTK